MRLFASILIFVFIAWIVLVYLEFESFRTELEHLAEKDRKFYDEFCLDDDRISAHERIRNDCHEAKHAIFDDVFKKALKEVLIKWIPCSNDGCEKIASNVSNSFSYVALAIGSAIGIAGVFTAWKIFSRRYEQTLPGGNVGT